jgi:hypothetical protein
MYYTILSNDTTKQFFFSSDHCQRLSSTVKLSKDWVPITFWLPMQVVPRPSLPDGVVDTLDKYIQLFHNDETEIENPDPKYRVANRAGLTEIAF